MSREERRKVIQKSVKLVGWMDTRARLKTQEDREVYEELAAEFRKSYRAPS